MFFIIIIVTLTLHVINKKIKNGRTKYVTVEFSQVAKKWINK